MLGAQCPGPTRIAPPSSGHGGDVRWVDWHPTKGVIASCSKDACVKLWDPRRGGSCLTTLHGHKNGVFQVRRRSWRCRTAELAVPYRAASCRTARPDTLASVPPRQPLALR